MDWFYLYACIAAIMLIAGLVMTAAGTGRDKRLGARLALTCWAWPVWGLIAIAVLYTKAEYPGWTYLRRLT